MRLQDLARRRMHNLRLAGDRCEAPADVVRWLGAMQSQDYGPAMWSIGERVSGADHAAVERAFADGAILRTHLLRPTWHFVAPEDIRWMLELTAPRVHAQNAYYYRQFGLDPAALAKATKLLTKALRGGNHQTRGELAAQLEGTGLPTEGLPLGYALMNAELNGVICSGPRRGKQHTYALVEERVPRSEILSAEEALAEITLRYFTGHGPATIKDMKWWSSLTMATISDGLDMVGSALTSESIDGITYWSAPQPPAPEVPSPEVHLLQGYDEYFVGYGETRSVINLAGFSLPPDAPVLVGAVVLDTQLAGHWKRALKKSSVHFEVALYEPFDAAQLEALQTAADEQGEFLGRTATVETTTL